jgi:cell division protein FtsQ
MRKTRGTRKKTYMKRRSARMQRLGFLVRRFGRLAGGGVFVLWLGAWFVLSGGMAKMQEKTRADMLGLTAHAGFAAENVLVEGRVNTSAALVKEIVGMEKGDPLLAFDPVRIRADLEALPWVETARVERRLPDTVYINLQERRPLALWQRKGALLVIDARGTPIGGAEPGRFKEFLIVMGDDAPAHAPEFLALLGAEPELEAQTRYAARIGKRRWDLILRRNIRVKLPEDDTGLALRRLMAMQEESGLLDKDIVSVDLRDPARIIVRPHAGAARTWNAGGRGV